MARKNATSFEAAFDIPGLAETLAAEVVVRIRLQLAGDGLEGVYADLLLLSGRKAVILLDGAIECSLLLFAKFRRDFRHRLLDGLLNLLLLDLDLRLGLGLSGLRSRNLRRLDLGFLSGFLLLFRGSARSEGQRGDRKSTRLTSSH